MARPGVTYHDVANAAIELAAQGKSPTIESVRGRLGGRGSSSTIGPHLRHWKSQQNEDQIAHKENIPADLLHVVKGLWERINHLASERITTHEEKSAQLIREFQKERDDWQENYHRLHKEFESLSQQKDLLAVGLKEREEAFLHLKEEQTALIVLRDQLSKQLEEKQSRVDELHRLHQQVQANLEHYREAAREQRLLDQRKYEEREQQLEQALRELKTHLKKKEEAASKIEQQHFLSIKENEELKKLKEVLMQELEITKNTLAESEKTHGHLAHDLEKHRLSLQQTEERLKEALDEKMTLQTELALLSQHHQYAKRETELLISKEAAWLQEKWLLLQEKAQLEGQLKQLNQFITKREKA